MIPPPPPFFKKEKTDQNCSVRVHPLTKEWMSDLKNMNNIMIPTPTFEQWVAMRNAGIDFRQHACL